MYDIIISLNSKTSHLKYLKKTIESLLNQNIKPTKIIINIPDKFYLKDISFNNPIIIINIIKNDYLNNNKILGLFENDIYYNLNENSYILFLEDDLIYKNYMLNLFTYYIENYNILVSSINCVKISDDEYIANILEGLFIKKNLLEGFPLFYNKIKTNVNINYYDDLLISYFIKLKHKNIYNILIFDDNIYEKDDNTIIIFKDTNIYKNYMKKFDKIFSI